MAYPMTGLHFEVKWGDSQNTSSFSEVSGLTMEAEAVEYRSGDDRALTVQKIPGLMKFGNVSMGRGIMPKEAGDGLFAWYQTIRAGDVERRTVTISLLNEEREPVMTWTVKNAWPVKVEGPGLNSTGNEIAVEKIEFANEGIVVTVAGG
jgi:phage tail-like protein